MCWGIPHVLWRTGEYTFYSVWTPGRIRNVILLSWGHTGMDMDGHVPYLFGTPASLLGEYRCTRHYSARTL